MLNTSLATLGIDVGTYSPSLILSPTASIPSEFPQPLKDKIYAVRNIIRQYEESRNQKPVTINNAKDIYDLVADTFAGLTHEEVHAVFLKKNRTVIDVKKLFVGSMSATLLDANEILREALKLHATAVVLVHNHPSGNCLPSSNDIEQTQKLARTLRVLDVSLVDHLIVSETSFYSFADEKITHLNLQKN